MAKDINEIWDSIFGVDENGKKIDPSLGLAKAKDANFNNNSAKANRDFNQAANQHIFDRLDAEKSTNPITGNGWTEAENARNQEYNNRKLGKK